MTNSNSNQKRESFIVYSSFFDAIELLPESKQLLLFRAITNYGLYRTEPQLEGIDLAMWLLIKPQMDANWKRYEDGCKGGAPKGNTNASKNNRTTQNNQKQPNDNVNENVNEKDNGNGNGNTIETTTTTTPSLEIISDYIATNSLNVDAQQFHDYYTANGWRLGKNPMADWRAALRNWSRRPDPHNPQPEPQNTTFKVTHYDDL